MRTAAAVAALFEGEHARAHVEDLRRAVTDQQMGRDEIEPVLLPSEPVGAGPLGFGERPADGVQDFVGVTGDGQWGAHHLSVLEVYVDQVNYGG